MFLSIIALPNNFVADISTNATTFLADMGPYLVLIIGVLLTITVISILIGTLKG